MRALVPLCVAIVLIPAPSMASVIFVNRALTTGANDGSSWTNAFRGRPGVQQALAVAGAGDEIWIAAGSYAPAPTGGSPASAFVIPSGVALLGGFAGHEAEAAQREPATNQVILTGDLNSNDKPSDSSTKFDNAFHVVRVANATSGTIIDGCTIEGGLAEDRPMGVTPDVFAGGGVLIDGGAPTLRRCIIRENEASQFGGGIRIIGGATLIEDCSLTRNHAFGGAYIHTGGGATTTIRRCSFVEANANLNSVRGGAIGQGISVTGPVDTGSSMLIEDCYFSIQLAPFLAADGVGVKVYAGDAVIRRCRFIRCTHGGSGGGVSAGSFSIPPTSHVTIDRCDFI
ncbi:MAG TPA: right-handed parallel beta-helix repeat-containing protein, partial [Phycisphaerales bacterium]|nr:right-handed parallel beta-helix repeat-containing protein [Phycisphaerales bacterium]